MSMSDNTRQKKQILLDQFAALLEQTDDNQSMIKGLFDIAVEQARHVDPELPKLMYGCGLTPHFDTSLIGVMRGGATDEVKNRRLLEYITSNSFVRREDRGYVYHNSLRKELLSDLQNNINAVEGLLELLSALGKYYLERWQTLTDGDNYAEALIQLVALEDIEIDPELTLFLKIFGAMMAGNFKEALNAVNSLLEYYPDEVTLLELKAAISLIDDAETSEEDWNVVINKRGDNALGYFGRGNAKYKGNKFDEAIADYSKGIELDPHIPLAYVNRGTAYMRLLSYNQALADYNHAITLDPNIAIAYINRGNIYMRLSAYNQAIADYNQAITLDPNYAAAYDARGLLLSIQKQYEQSILDFTKSLEIDANSLQTTYNYSVALSRINQLDEAKKQIKRAEKLLAKEKDKERKLYTQAGLLALEQDDKSLEVLENAMQHGSYARMWVDLDPAWLNYHDDPRFQRLIAD